MDILKDSLELRLTRVVELRVQRCSEACMENCSIFGKIDMVLHEENLTPLNSPWIFERSLVFSTNFSNSLETVYAFSFSWV